MSVSSNCHLYHHATLYSCMGVVMFSDPPTTDGADFLSDLMTQHILDRATNSMSPPPLSHSHLHQVHHPHTSHSRYMTLYSLPLPLPFSLSPSPSPPLPSPPQLLSVISAVEVTLSSACQQLLRSFYLASRRVRSSSLHGTDMPVNALDIM